MKTAWLLTSIFFLFCRASVALYGPETYKAPAAVATMACQQSDFKQAQAIVHALQSNAVADALAVLPQALRELRSTPNTSSRYAARALCVHELTPSAIAGPPYPAPSWVVRMKALGVRYTYYEPDGLWLNGLIR